MSHILYADEITVTKKGEPDQPLLLGNFDGQGGDVRQALYDFLAAPAHQVWVDKDVDAAARIVTVHGPTDDEPAIVDAMIEAGETGLASKFVATTGNQLGTKVDFTRRPDHAEMVPVLVLAKLPGLHAKGLLLTHSPSGRGIKTKFWLRFKNWFTDRYPDYVLHQHPTYPEGFYTELLQKRALTKVQLVKHVQSRDVTDANIPWFPPTELGTITTVFTPRRRRFLAKPAELLDALENDEALAGLLTFRNETYDEIKATVTGPGGRQHTINLSGGAGGRPGYDISDQVEDGADGPTYESLRKAALGYIEVLSGG